MSQFLCILQAYILVILISCSASPERLHINVRGEIFIPANSTITVNSPELLNTPNYWNALCLQPEKPEQISLSKSIFLAVNGNEFVPKIVLKNKSGGEDIYSKVSELGGIEGLMLCFEPESRNQKLQSPYSFIIISSPESIRLKAIKWHSSDK